MVVLFKQGSQSLKNATNGFVGAVYGANALNEVDLPVSNALKSDSYVFTLISTSRPAAAKFEIVTGKEYFKVDEKGTSQKRSVEEKPKIIMCKPEIHITRVLFSSNMYAYT